MCLKPLLQHFLLSTPCELQCCRVPMTQVNDPSPTTPYLCPGKHLESWSPSGCWSQSCSRARCSAASAWPGWRDLQENANENEMNSADWCRPPEINNNVLWKLPVISYILYMVCIDLVLAPRRVYCAGDVWGINRGCRLQAATQRPQQKMSKTSKHWNPHKCNFSSVQQTHKDIQQKKMIYAHLNPPSKLCMSSAQHSSAQGATAGECGGVHL